MYANDDYLDSIFISDHFVKLDDGIGYRSECIQISKDCELLQVLYLSVPHDVCGIGSDVNLDYQTRGFIKNDSLYKIEDWDDMCEICTYPKVDDSIANFEILLDKFWPLNIPTSIDPVDSFYLKYEIHGAGNTSYYHYCFTDTHDLTIGIEYLDKTSTSKQFNYKIKTVRTREFRYDLLGREVFRVSNSILIYNKRKLVKINYIR